MASIGPAFTVPRQPPRYRPVDERVHDSGEVALLRDDPVSQGEASRCLECGVPFCHWSCPLGNRIPDWNGHTAAGRWELAYEALQATNNLPEITGRVCPAFCEAGCVLGLHWEAVTVRENELAVVEHAFQAGFVRPRPPARRTGRAVAIVGSGPAGLAGADQLNQAGHRVVVFERDARIGGLLRYGIPDFKLDKGILDRRLAIWRAEGIEFVTGVTVGGDLPARRLLREFDAVCLATGARAPRDLAVEGRGLAGIHFAMEYLAQANRLVTGEPVPPAQRLDARGKRVVVIGGGDTGADCVGTAIRQGAARVVQLELLARPPDQRPPANRWPQPPMTLKTSTSHEEGCGREWSVLTKRFLGTRGTVSALACVRVAPIPGGQRGPLTITELPGTAFEMEAELVLLAMGFTASDPEDLLRDFAVRRSPQGTIETDAHHRTSAQKIFAAGDVRRGQSLVVHAIREGRRVAHAIDSALMGRSALPQS